MVSAVGTTTILPIADRSPARAIPLQNAYSDRVDQYDTISVHTAISSQNEQSVQNGAISPRIIIIITVRIIIITISIIITDPPGTRAESGKSSRSLIEN